jgi:hypothetical protein
MAKAADREELRDSLHDTDDDGLDEVHLLSAS